MEVYTNTSDVQVKVHERVWRADPRGTIHALVINGLPTDMSATGLLDVQQAIKAYLAALDRG